MLQAYTPQKYIHVAQTLLFILSDLNLLECAAKLFSSEVKLSPIGSCLVSFSFLNNDTIEIILTH